MKQRLLPIVAAILLIISLDCKSNGTAAVEQTSRKKTLDSTACTDGAQIRVDNYVLDNNVWGKANITAYQQCITAKQNDTATIFAWQWDWPSLGNNVKAYPEIIFGFKPFGNSSSSPILPKKIATIQSADISFSSYTTTINGTGNLAFDIWINDSSSPTSSNIKHEIMIWFEKKVQQPAGSFVEQVTIDGSTYDYYKGPLAWDYIAFIKTSTNKVTSVKINEFLKYLQNKNHISGTEFLSAIEFGNEVVSGTGWSIITNYKIDIK